MTPIGHGCSAGDVGVYVLLDEGRVPSSDISMSDDP